MRKKTGGLVLCLLVVFHDTILEALGLAYGLLMLFF